MSAAVSWRSLARGSVVFEKGPLAIGCLHAKSGQTGLTKHELESYTGYLSTKYTYWLLFGDLNWSFRNAYKLSIPKGAVCISCWKNESQRKGSVLDWCIYSKSTLTITARSSPSFRFMPPLMTSMTTTDHKPVQYDVRKGRTYFSFM